MKYTKEQMYACIDLGSNMFRVVIGKHQKGMYSLVRSFSWMIGIGNHDGYIDAHAINKIILGATKAKKIITMYPGIKVFCVATAAMRSASNADHIRNILRDRCGFICQIIDPGSEVMLGGMGCKDVFLNGYSIFIDMGGGSTEIGLFKKTSHSFALINWISLPYGLFYCAKFTQSVKTEYLTDAAKVMIKNFLGRLFALTNKNIPLVLCKSGVTAFITSYMSKIEFTPRSSFQGKILQKDKLYDVIDAILNMSDVEIIKNKIINHILSIHSLRGSLSLIKEIISLLPTYFVIIGDGGVKEGMLKTIAGFL